MRHRISVNAADGRREHTSTSACSVVQSDTKVIWCQTAICEERAADGIAVVRRVVTDGEQVGGVARYENDYYHRISNDIEQVPGNPWFICTLWLADYYITVARDTQELKRALPIFEWTASHALESGILAEQVNPYTNEPISVSPLTWSHATVVSTATAEQAMRTTLVTLSKRLRARKSGVRRREPQAKPPTAAARPSTSSAPSALARVSR